MAKKARSPIEKEYAFQNQRLLRNIKRRMARLLSRKTPYAGPAASRYLADVESGALKLSTRGLSLKELKQQNKMLKYINSLKTSRVKGMKVYEKTWIPLQHIIEGNEDWTSRFFSLYNRLVEENGIWEKYKYEIYDVIQEGLENNLSDEEIRNNVIAKIQELYDAEQDIPIEDIISF